MPALRWTVFFCALAISLVAATATPADARERRCLGDYTYAGVMGRNGVHGVSARIAPLRAPDVAGGHVAAWVGIGGEGLGPGGWDGGKGACNGFAYRFTRVTVSTTAGGAWHPLRRPQVIEDPGLRVLRRLDGFDARALS